MKKRNAAKPAPGTNHLATYAATDYLNTARDLRIRMTDAENGREKEMSSQLMMEIDGEELYRFAQENGGVTQVGKQIGVSSGFFSKISKRGTIGKVHYKLLCATYGKEEGVWLIPKKEPEKTPEKAPEAAPTAIDSRLIEISAETNEGLELLRKELVRLNDQYEKNMQDVGSVLLDMRNSLKKIEGAWK